MVMYHEMEQVAHPQSYIPLECKPLKDNCSFFSEQSLNGSSLSGDLCCLLAAALSLLLVNVRHCNMYFYLRCRMEGGSGTPGVVILALIDKPPRLSLN